MCKVLIVDDDESVLELLMRILQKENTVFTAQTISHAEFIINAHNPDVVLFDINLPDGRGDSPELHERVPSTIIILTGTPVEDREKAALLRNGVFDIMSKPFCCDVIAEKVKKAAIYHKAMGRHTQKNQTAIIKLEEAQREFRKATSFLHGLTKPAEAVG